MSDNILLKNWKTKPKQNLIKHNKNIIQNDFIIENKKDIIKYKVSFLFI